MLKTPTKTRSIRKRAWRVAGWLVVPIILLLPLIAMRLTPEVSWTASDFAVMAALLIAAGLVLELAIWKIRKPRSRMLVAIAVVGAVLLVWAEGAVGIFV